MKHKTNLLAAEDRPLVLIQLGKQLPVDFDITLIGFGPKIYNDAIAIFSTDIIRVISLALIASLLFHAFNGIRIILIDFWPAGYKYQQAMFYIVLAVTIVSFLPMAYYVMAPAFGYCPQGSCENVAL